VQPGTAPPDSWYMDSGASVHVTPNLNALTEYSPYSGSDQLQVGDGKGLEISHIGTTYLSTGTVSLLLSNVLHVQTIFKPLLSISKLTADNNAYVEFHTDYCLIKDQASHQVLLKGIHLNGLYLVSSHSPSAFVCEKTTGIWHQRLCHSSETTLKQLISKNLISCTQNNLGVCESCCLAKSHRLPFPSSSTRTSHPLELVHCDLWGPSPVTSHTGNRYYVLFTDDYSRYSWIYFCSQKSVVLSIFSQFKTLVENLLSCQIKTLQMDGGTEFLPIMRSYPSIQFHVSCPYTPQQNGLVERKHRHIVELSLATMFNAHIPQLYWSDIFESVVFVINRLPTSSLESDSPYQVLFSKSPDYAFLKVLGCSCYPYIRPYAANKLSPRSTPCVFLGYSIMYKGYKCLSLNTNKIYISRHVIFDEYSFSFTKTSAPATSSLSPSHTSSLVVIPPYHPPQQTSSSDKSDSLSSPLTPSPPLRNLPASTSVPSPPVSNTPLLVYTRRKPSLSQKPSSTASLHPMQTCSKAKPPSHALLSVCDPNVHSLDPTSYTQASKFQHWRDAMAQELAALAHNNTWSLVPISEASNVVGCKWVFKTKRHSTGKIERYKARLVAKGYTQEEGLDFTDTLSPVVKPTTIRIILSFAVMNN
jgi:Reverse transcriptase (RNA-dependent DNA polymerase)/GAG-pre-integrase domain